MKRVFASMLAAAMVAGAFAGCGSSGSSSAPAASSAPDAGSSAPAASSEAPAAAPSGDSIKIGVLAPLTGEVSDYGIATSNGIKMAFEEINANGGILGQQVELVLMDEKGDPTEAVNAYNSMVSQGVVAVIGDVTSKPCQAVADVAVEDNMPMLTATGTAAGITLTGDNVFRTCYTDPFQGTIMATFAADNLGAKKVAILRNNSEEYSSGLTQAFKAQAAVKGIEIVSEEAYAGADIDFNVQINNLIAQSPEAIFVPDYYDKVALILDQVRAGGYEGPVLGGDGWDGVLNIISADKMSVTENTYFANHYADEDEKAAKFLSDYKAKFNLDGRSFSALGYDSAYIIAQAIENAGSTDSQAIINAMAAADYDGITGHITFDENGDPIKTVSVLKCSNGAAVLEAKVEA